MNLMKRIIILLGFTAVAIILILVKFLVFPGNKDKAVLSNITPALPVEYYIARDTMVCYQVETVGTLPCITVKSAVLLKVIVSV